MGEAIQFGVMVPQLGSGDYTASRRVAQQAEALGYDSVWVADHLFGIPGPEDTLFMECWTLLTALAVETSRVRVGTMTLCNGFRHPALLAKMAATLDVICGGRLELGIGSGWYEREFLSYGYPFPKASVRARQLDEALQILKHMWSEPTTNFAGAHYQIVDAPNEPKPLQKPRPPIHIGGDGEKIMLPLVARHADWWSYWMAATSDGFRYKLGVLERCCKEAGRDFASLKKSLIGPIVVVESEKEIPLLLADLEKKGLHFGARIGMMGTADMVRKRLEEYQQLGVSLFIVAPLFSAWQTFLPLLKEQVISQLR